MSLVRSCLLAIITLQLASIMLTGSATAAVAHPGKAPTSAAASLANAENEVFDKLSRSGFSGAVAVHLGGHSLLDRASGRAAAGRAFTTDTKVDIASISKPITAIAIFRLIELGKVHLDDPLARWFPDCPEDKSAITIRQMLNHTSGLVDIPPGMSDYRPTSAAEMRQRIFDAPLDFRPGSENRYSNSGFNLLGMIVEKASGVSLPEFLQEHVFDRAHIRASYDPETFAAADVADGPVNATIGQSVRDLAAARRGPFWGLWGAGGIFMSARDLAKMFDAYRAGRIVSKQTVARMIADAVPAGSYASEALGWTIIHTSRGDDFISYTGGSEHSNTALRYYPKRNLVIAVVANSISPGAVRVARSLAEPLVGPDFRPNPVPPGVPPLAAAPEADARAIQEFMSAVAGDAAVRRKYVESAFEPSDPVEALVERLGNLASVGVPKVISIYHDGNDSVLLFETIESEYPRMYQLRLHRSAAAGKISKYTIKRV